MMRFFSMSLDAVRAMDNEDALKLYDCIEIIRAQEQLDRVQVANFPSQKKKQKRKMINDLSKTARPRGSETTLTMDQLADMIAGRSKDGRQ